MATGRLASESQLPTGHDDAESEMSNTLPPRSIRPLAGLRDLKRLAAALGSALAAGWELAAGSTLAAALGSVISCSKSETSARGTGRLGSTLAAALGSVISCSKCETSSRGTGRLPEPCNRLSSSAPVAHTKDSQVGSRISCCPGDGLRRF